ncbi:hypothetical protein V1687_11640 [Pseudomonas putida]|uniref:hypothetical protein n=1 Tax=Pseudomonas putida TaxID=303 RepID=UPI002ED20865|nr:hypothetical protein V1687_11640 [Pseudomonas putida]
MSEQAKRYEQAVVDAVVAGDANRLESALRRLSKCDGSVFLNATKRLLNTEQAKSLSTMVSVGLLNTLSPFYYEDEVVYGAAYTESTAFMAKDAHRSGVGIPRSVVLPIVEQARAEYDAAVLKRVQGLKAEIRELDSLLYGHSSADYKLINFGISELLKGQALLLAAAASDQ